MKPGLLLLFFVPCVAQDGVDAFLHIGRTRLGGDEGSIGSVTSFGGAVMVPLTNTWGLDLDLQTGHVRMDDVVPQQSFSIRRTLFLPSLIRRARFSDRVYGFAGGGIGGQVDRTRFSYATFRGEPPVMTGITEGESTDSGFTLHGKAGVVGALTPRLLVRGDLFLAFRYVLPSIGVRIGVGYRF